MNASKPVVIALCGKGGVGKTSIAALLVKHLTDNPAHRVLAIDADPAIGLAMALGFPVNKSVDQIRNELIRQLESKETSDLSALSAQLDYELLDTVQEKQNLAFLAIGRPEKAGCYCRINAVLRDLIRTLSHNFDYVIIDGEAGVEQVNRRVMDAVTHLVLVSDDSRKGIQVAETIASLADQSLQYRFMGLLFNRLNEADVQQLQQTCSLNVMGWLPEDDDIKQFDREGRTFLQMKTSPATEQINIIVKRLLS